MAMHEPGANVGDKETVGEAVTGLPVGAGVVGAASPSMDTSALEGTVCEVWPQYCLDVVRYIPIVKLFGPELVSTSIIGQWIATCLLCQLALPVGRREDLSVANLGKVGFVAGRKAAVRRDVAVAEKNLLADKTVGKFVNHGEVGLGPPDHELLS